MEQGTSSQSLDLRFPKYSFEVQGTLTHPVFCDTAVQTERAGHSYPTRYPTFYGLREAKFI